MDGQTIALKPGKDKLLGIILVLFVVWNYSLQARLSNLQNESKAMAIELQQLIKKTSPRYLPLNKG